MMELLLSFPSRFSIQGIIPKFCQLLGLFVQSIYSQAAFYCFELEFRLVVLSLLPMEDTIQSIDS